MYIYELHESKTPKAPKPRNFVAKNAPKAGAGAHKDKKKAAKQGDVKHKGKVAEGLKDPKDNPCWKGYKPVGTKKKNGRTVPNCVPKESIDTELDESDLARSLQLLALLKADPKIANVIRQKEQQMAVMQTLDKTLPKKSAAPAVQETATPGSTSAGSIATVVSPHLAIGKPNKSYTGSPGKSGTKAPKPPKVKMQKPSDNALDMKTNIFGEGNAIKR